MMKLIMTRFYEGGPWFVREHFLVIKPWEPYFKVSEASFSSVAVWVRFPELPIEFYDSSVLREIRSAIGPVLRIDSYTASGSKGSYVRMCIQIDLSKPLINTVRMGRLHQKMMYEGISSLCFCCERLGHKQERCNYQVKPPEKASKDDQSTQTLGTSESQQKDNKFGEWMLVTRKKHPVKAERSHGTSLTN